MVNSDKDIQEVILIKGQVIKLISNRYSVLSEGTVYICSARGKMRLGEDIFVGDYVNFEAVKGSFGTIESIDKRKNSLIRPYVANIDKAIIVIANEPKPDLLLVDKIILNCYYQGIEPILCFNKLDIASQLEIDSVFSDYAGELKMLRISAASRENLKSLEDEIKGSVVCFAGQSAVGKSSLLNAMLNQDKIEVGELSERIKRGKNTTRHIEIYEVLGGMVVDTCGFSMLECIDIKAEDLCYYYEDYVKLSSLCKFSGCQHICEPDCKVRKEVSMGKLSKGRYERYIEIFNELKEKERKKYE